MALIERAGECDHQGGISHGAKGKRCGRTLAEAEDGWLVRVTDLKQYASASELSIISTACQDCVRSLEVDTALKHKIELRNWRSGAVCVNMGWKRGSGTLTSR